MVTHFNSGNISSDSGGLLLRQVEQITDIIRQFARCFTDHRYSDLIEQIKATVHKVWVCLSENYPYQQLFKQVYENLRRFCKLPILKNLA
ncbi:MAG: hypothetical protein DRP62_01095 [Planctomycetota bacterium]|nr:MAG: hypothetical protein DRP62_01095 [Planctomycetota bacterium]